MKINYNDVLQRKMRLYYGYDVNPFYGLMISYLLEINFNDKLINDRDKYKQIKKLENILKTNPKIFKEKLKEIIKSGILEDLSFRYEYSNKFYKKRDDENHFSILKFKIIDGKLYAYDLITSRENRKYVEIKQINGVLVSDIITLLKNDGYTDEEIEVLIQHKEVLQAYGIKSKEYNITILNNSDLINIQLDDPDIRLDFSIFYKEHPKSILLDKTNFNLRQESSDSNVSYEYDSNLKLLSLLHGLCKSQKDLSLFESIYEKNVSLFGNSGNANTNLDWMFISSFFLFNQEEKKSLPDYIYLDLFRKLKLVNPRGAMCILLDENNEEISYVNNAGETNYGCNDYVFSNGCLDARILFHAIRNALAHSSYEVVDNNYIRIYGYNDKNKMNCNFKIQKDIIIEFINKLFNYNSFGNIFPICTLDNPKYDNTPIQTKEELKSYLKSIVVSDITDVRYHDLDTLRKLQMYISLFQKKNSDINEKVDYKMLEIFEYDYEMKIYNLKRQLQNPMTKKTEIIDSVIKSQLKYFMIYKLEEKKLTEAQISKIIDRIEQISDTFYGHGATNQHEIITELIRNELNPSRNISMILEDIVRTGSKTDGSIMDMLNDTPTKYIDYDKVIKATVIAYLNNILLYSYNEKKVDSSGLDFSNMKLNLQRDIENMKKFKRDQHNKKNNIKEQIKDADGNIVLSKIKYYKNLLKNPKLSEEQKKKLQQELSLYEDMLNKGLQDEKIKYELEQCDKAIAKADEEILMINTNPNKYVLEHLRNSLAHGNIFFSDTIDLNNIGDLEITFIDYYPGKEIESFSGTIKFRDLLSILNDERYIKSLFKDDTTTNKKKKD